MSAYDDLATAVSTAIVKIKASQELSMLLDAEKAGHAVTRSMLQDAEAKAAALHTQLNEALTPAG